MGLSRRHMVPGSPFATLSFLGMHNCPFLLCNFFQKGVAKNKHLDKDRGEALRSDILSNLAPRYGGEPAYELFKTIMYSGGDPLEFHEHLVKVRSACKGEWPCLHK